MVLCDCGGDGAVFKWADKRLWPINRLRDNVGKLRWDGTRWCRCDCYKMQWNYNSKKYKMKFMKNNIIALLHGHGIEYCTVFQEPLCGVSKTLCICTSLQLDRWLLSVNSVDWLPYSRSCCCSSEMFNKLKLRLCVVSVCRTMISSTLL